ncbi:MAG: MarR family winged helix-turn-helix transcriptional regulator [Nitriliruptoraceae bacterium]
MEQAPDHVDGLIAQWAEERPELDVHGLAIAARIIRLQRFIDRRTRSVVEAHGLTIGETNVLAALRRAGAPHTLTPTELYRSLLLSSAAMTHRLDRLEELGYVTRCRAERDRRRIQVSLTPEGLTVVDRVMDAYTAQLSELLASLEDTDRAALEGSLRQLLRVLERQEEPPSEV